MALHISETGARNGESIIGVQKQCQGTVMQIRGSYPPLRSWIVNLTPEKIRDRFNNYRFFQRMSFDERKEWLHSHASDFPDLYLEDIPDLEVKFIKISGDFMIKSLSPEIISLLLQGNPNNPDGYWPIQEIYNLFPRKPGSRARKHTLIFRPKNWGLVEDATVIPKLYTGLAVHLESGKVWKDHFITANYPNFFIMDSDPPVAIIASTHGPAITYTRLENICRELGLNLEIMAQIKSLLDWAPPSIFKSLIQKILRTRCTHVEWVDVEYPAKEFLATAFCLLLIHPGAFVPNIQRFVSGIESALKRMAVSIAEDAFLENPEILTSLLAATWVVQNQEWSPSDEILKVWIFYSLSALDYPYMFDYEWHTIFDLSFDNLDSLTMGAFLLNNIKSFTSDIKMMLSIAERKGAPTSFHDLREKRVMPLVHCVDHHCFTNIAHFIPYSVIKDIGSYEELFNLIWQRVTGSNPRKGPYLNESDPFVNIIRSAQTAVWISQIYPPQSLPLSQEYIDLEYRLDPSWLASLIGSVEIPVGRSTAITMTNPDDLSDFSAIRRPSRDKTLTELTEEEKIIAIDKFKESLKTGRVLKNIPSTLSFLQGGTVFLKNDDYYLRLNGQLLKWDDMINLHFKLGLHFEPTDNYMYRALTTTGDGIREKGPEDFETFLSELPLEVLQRAMIYLDYRTEIDLVHIGRSGKGVDYCVKIEDTGVNHLLAAIACYYPAALVKHKFKYRVKNGPLMWYLRDKILNRILEVIPPSVSEWPQPKEETRLLWQHQTDSINELMRTKHIKKARIIYLSPGLGKTAIVANYIANQIRNGTMSKYCLYTLPPSALKTVEKEFELLGIPFQLLDMRVVSKTSKEILPGIVNVIYHDHLRMADIDHIKAIAPEMLFIVDEFHKTLNATIRTSTALEIAHLSKDVVAMTGTLIKDNKIEPIIAWLSMAVNFEVTKDNFWVALSSIFSRKVQTKVAVERVVVDAEMDEDERERYYKVVPKNLGGTAQKIDFREALEISYETVTRKMISMILFHLKHGLGVFVVARNITHQNYIRDRLAEHGITNVFLIGKDHAINLTPSDPPPGVSVPDVVITHPGFVEGYNLTRYQVMISSVLLKNITVQQQLEGRINRLSQTAPSIRIMIIHAGVLSYIYRNQESARRLSDTIKGFAKEVGIDVKDIEF